MTKADKIIARCDKITPKQFDKQYRYNDDWAKMYGIFFEMSYYSEECVPNTQKSRYVSYLSEDKKIEIHLDFVTEEIYVSEY